jgi:excisionase family DNA binding protein
MLAEVTNPGVECTYGLPMVLTVEEAAEFLRVNVKTLYSSINDGEFPGRKIGRRIVIFRDSLIRWFKIQGHVLSSRKRRS